MSGNLGRLVDAHGGYAMTTSQVYRNHWAASLLQYQETRSSMERFAQERCTESESHGDALPEVMIRP